MDSAARTLHGQRSRRGSGWYEGTDMNLATTDQNFMWWRARMLGGRTNHWGRIALRMGPYDFKPRSRDGLGIDCHTLRRPGVLLRQSGSANLAFTAAMRGWKTHPIRRWNPPAAA